MDIARDKWWSAWDGSTNEYSNKWIQQESIPYMERLPLYSNTPPQTFASPIDTAKCLAFIKGKALVNMSAVISSVGQYMR